MINVRVGLTLTPNPKVNPKPSPNPNRNYNRKASDLKPGLYLTITQKWAPIADWCINVSFAALFAVVSRTLDLANPMHQEITEGWQTIIFNSCLATYYRLRIESTFGDFQLGSGLGLGLGLGSGLGDSVWRAHLVT